jgi:outer membrane protein
VAQAESRLAGAQAQFEQADGSLQVTRATFQRVIGLVPQRLVTPGVLVPPARSADAAVRSASDNNPFVVAALFDEAAARDNIDIQFGALLPQANVVAQGFRIDNNTAPGQRATGGQVTANLSVPIYQGGAEQSAVRQARQQAQAARQVVEEARRSAAQNARQAWEQFRTAAAQVTSVRSQIRAQEIALDGVQREAVVGSRTTLDVLNAEQELLNARTSLVQAAANQVIASYALAQTMGRLTAHDLRLPVQLYDVEAYYRAVRNRWIGTGDFSGNSQPVAEPAPNGGQ